MTTNIDETNLHVEHLRPEAQAGVWACAVVPPDAGGGAGEEPRP